MKGKFKMHYTYSSYAKPAQLLSFVEILEDKVTAVTVTHIKGNICFNLGAHTHTCTCARTHTHTQRSSESNEGSPA